MEALSNFISWQSIVATIALYYATLALYRLYLHPLAQFPGPKLAAVTRWYEGYYDLYQSGQYTFKIAELHKQYGEEDQASGGFLQAAVLVTHFGNRPYYPYQPLRASRK